MTSMKFNFSGLQELADAITSSSIGEEAVRGATLQIANEWMAKAQARTPSPTGTMKSSWHVDDEGRKGNDHQAKVYNTAVSGEKGAPYPIYVEYGHRQQPGRYVPAIGKRLVKAWVPGQFMLTKSRYEMEGRVQAIISAHMKKVWDEL